MTWSTMLVLAAMAAATVSSQPPQLGNAQVRVQAAGGNLVRAVDDLVAATGNPGWIAYAVPLLPGDRMLCDWSGESYQRVPAPGTGERRPEMSFVFLSAWKARRARYRVPGIILKGCVAAEDSRSCRISETRQ